MTFAITSLYASVLSVLFIGLSTSVTLHRVRTGVSILHDGDMALAESMRRHGNFAENVPFVLLLIACVEAAGAPGLLLHALGGALVLGRMAHAAGLKHDAPKAPLRIVGGSLTQLVMLISVAFLVWSHLGR